MIAPLLLSTLSVLFLRLSFAFDATSKENVALYWGQNSAGTQESLGTYCQSSNADIYLLSFLYEFPTIGLNFANACTTSFSDGLLHCAQIAEDIKTCQSLGKKVLLSMGGASGAYGFTSDDQATEFAQTLWATFGEGSGASERPFDTAVVDGFDFDIENNNPLGYAALVTELRSLFSSGTKDYYISAAPQCPYPDASVGNLLANAEVDFAFIQFYNNYCSVEGTFNWDTWLNYAETVSPNKDIKLFLGLPGSATAAGSGYISSLSVLESTVADISTSDYFGGIAVWDASQAFSNEIDGEPYVAQLKSILENDGQATSGSTTSTSTSTEVITSTIPSTSTSTSSATSTSISTSIESTSIATSSIQTENKQKTSTTSSVGPGTTTIAPNDPVTMTVTPTTTTSSSLATSTGTTTLEPSSSSSTVDTAAHAIAKQLNAQYSAGDYNGKSSCSTGDIACSADGEFAICNFGSWVHMACAAGTTCYAYDTGNSVTTGCNYSSSKANYVA